MVGRLVAVLLFALLVGAGGCAPRVAGADAVVDMRESAFLPSVVRVPSGATVVWVNHDLYAHTVVGPSFASPRLDWHATWRYTFRAAGHYEYRCDPHPGMRGTVIVDGGSP